MLLAIRHWRVRQAKFSHVGRCSNRARSLASKAAPKSNNTRPQKQGQTTPSSKPTRPPPADNEPLSIPPNKPSPLPHQTSRQAPTQPGGTEEMKRWHVRQQIGYKGVTWRITQLIVGIPVVIVVGYHLYGRMFLGWEQKHPVKTTEDGKEVFEPIRFVGRDKPSQ